MAAQQLTPLLVGGALHAEQRPGSGVLAIIGVGVGDHGRVVGLVAGGGGDDEVYLRGVAHGDVSVLILHATVLDAGLDADDVGQLVVVQMCGIDESILIGSPTAGGVGIGLVHPVEVLALATVGAVVHHHELVGIGDKVGAAVGGTLILERGMAHSLVEQQTATEVAAVFIGNTGRDIHLAHGREGTEAQRVCSAIVGDGSREGAAGERVGTQAVAVEERLTDIGQETR